MLRLLTSALLIGHAAGDAHGNDAHVNVAHALLGGPYGAGVYTSVWKWGIPAQLVDHCYKGTMDCTGFYDKTLADAGDKKLKYNLIYTDIPFLGPGADTALQHEHVVDRTKKGLLSAEEVDFAATKQCLGVDGFNASGTPQTTYFPCKSNGVETQVMFGTHSASGTDAFLAAATKAGKVLVGNYIFNNPLYADTSKYPLLFRSGEMSTGDFTIGLRCRQYYHLQHGFGFKKLHFIVPLKSTTMGAGAHKSFEDDMRVCKPKGIMYDYELVDFYMADDPTATWNASTVPGWVTNTTASFEKLKGAQYVEFPYTNYVSGVLKIMKDMGSFDDTTLYNFPHSCGVDAARAAEMKTFGVEDGVVKNNMCTNYIIKDQVTFPPFLKALNMIDNTKLHAGAGKALDNLGVSFNNTFLENEDHFGFVWDAFVSVLYASATILKNGGAQADLTGANIYKHILKLDFTGPTGRVHYDSNGDRIKAVKAEYFHNPTANMDPKAVMVKSNKVFDFLSDCKDGDLAAAVKFSCTTEKKNDDDHAGHSDDDGHDDHGTGTTTAAPAAAPAGDKTTTSSTVRTSVMSLLLAPVLVASF